MPAAPPVANSTPPYVKRAAQPTTTAGPAGELETFVVVHDQDLLLECEKDGRFADIRRLRYILVGPRPDDKLTGMDNVVVARHLADNIEQFPNLLSFTGWYAVARNGLASTPWVTLLEYDVRLVRDFVPRSLEMLRAGRCVLGYVPFSFSHPQYLHATPWLIPALRTVHGIDLPRLVRDYLDAGGVDQWTATTNASLPKSELEKFVEWFLPLSRVFRHDPIGAHVHERALPVFCMLMRLPNLLLRDVLEHRQARSHGIRARSLTDAQEQADKMEACRSDVQRPGT